MSQATKEEIEAVKDEKVYWQELADVLGWTLYGWTYKSHVTYFSDRRNMVELTGKQRDDIMQAVRRSR